MANTFNGADIKKLKLLFTVVDRQKSEFYLDVLSQYEINCQLALQGFGTAQTELIDMLGLNNHKAVLVSVVREDMVDTVLQVLEDKFATIKNGKGVAFAVPLSSVIGVNLYQFLSNNRYLREENHENG